MCGSSNAGNGIPNNGVMNTGGSSVTNVPQMSSPKSGSRKISNPSMSNQHNPRNIYPGQNHGQVRLAFIHYIPWCRANCYWVASSGDGETAVVSPDWVS